MFRVLTIGGIRNTTGKRKLYIDTDLSLYQVEVGGCNAY